jgi:hypothetical protein
MNGELVEKYLDQLDKESKAFRDEALRMTWWMRGGISFDEAMLLCNQDRELINELIKENMEATKKSGLPFF